MQSKKITLSSIKRKAKRAAKKHRAKFWYILCGNVLDIAVSHEDGEWKYWRAHVVDEDCGGDD